MRLNGINFNDLGETLTHLLDLTKTRSAKMNKLTELFVDHLKRSPAREAVEQLVEDLQAAKGEQGTQVAVYNYTGSIHREFMVFMATCDVQAAALRLQD